MGRSSTKLNIEEKQPNVPVHAAQSNPSEIEQQKKARNAALGQIGAGHANGCCHAVGHVRLWGVQCQTLPSRGLLLDVELDFGKVKPEVTSGWPMKGRHLSTFSYYS